MCGRYYIDIDNEEFKKILEEAQRNTEKYEEKVMESHGINRYMQRKRQTAVRNVRLSDQHQPLH